METTLLTTTADARGLSGMAAVVASVTDEDRERLRAGWAFSPSIRGNTVVKHWSPAGERRTTTTRTSATRPSSTVATFRAAQPHLVPEKPTRAAAKPQPRRERAPDEHMPRVNILRLED